MLFKLTRRFGPRRARRLARGARLQLRHAAAVPSALNLPRPPSRDVVELRACVPLRRRRRRRRPAARPRPAIAGTSPPRPDGSTPSPTSPTRPPRPCSPTCPTQIVVGGEAGLWAWPFIQTTPTTARSSCRTPAPAGPCSSRACLASSPATTASPSTSPARSRSSSSMQPYTNHNGGGLGFDRDGYLYFSLGDGGAGRRPARPRPEPRQPARQDPPPRRRRRRRSVRHPGRQPYAGGGGRPRDLRSACATCGASASIAPPAIRAGDVGQNVWEEVDRIVLGGNYGWNIKEGRDCFGQDTCVPAPASSIPSPSTATPAAPP